MPKIGLLYCQDNSKFTLYVQLEKAQTDFSMIRDYRDLIKRGQEQLRQELESLNPDIKLGERFGEAKVHVHPHKASK